MKLPRKPSWLKVKIPSGERYREVLHAVNSGQLHTVCQSAHCPNMGECWDSGSATFMILGDICTRGCRFCAVERGQPGGAVDWEEPDRVALAARKMGLDYAVVTSVTRDDLDDGGAAVFSATVQSLREVSPKMMVEVLIPDYRGRPLETVINSGPRVLAHNVEVVERLTGLMRHGRASYANSLAVLEEAKSLKPTLLTKSSIMLGLGETDQEIRSAMGDLHRVAVDILVLGQYLQPTLAHAPVVAYLEPEYFSELAQYGKELGFAYVAAGPLVRTSYRAAEAFARSRS